jgi:serine protease Do
MRKYILTTTILLPLLLGCSHAAQSWTVDPPTTIWGFSSEDSGTGAYLGVDIMDINQDRLEALKLKEEHGVEVTMVDQDAPAGKAGIKEHDVILTMNGATIESKAQIQRMIHETPPGRLITLGLSRDGQPLSIKVQLGNRNKEFSYVMPKSKEYHFEMPQLPEIEIPQLVMVYTSARSGMMVENITPQLADFFGVKDGNGVLVRSVEKGSRADKAGLRAGDVIVRVGNQSVHDTGDFTHALRSRSGNSVGVNLIRDKKELTLTLSLPVRKESGEVIEEESLDEPLSDADIYYSDLGEAQAAILAEAGAMEQASTSAEQTRKSLCAQQRQLRRQVQKMQKQAGSAKHRIQSEQQRLQKEMQELQDEMTGDGLDI